MNLYAVRAIYKFEMARKIAVALRGTVVEGVVFCSCVCGCLLIDDGAAHR